MKFFRQLQGRIDDLYCLAEAIDRSRASFEDERKAGCHTAAQFWARMHDSYVREYNSRKFWFMGLEGELGYNEPAAFPVM